MGELAGFEDDAGAVGALLQAGDFVAARDYARSMLAQGRDSDAMRSLAAMLAARAGDASDAEVHLKILVERQPNDRANRLNLAQALIALELYEQVAPTLKPMPDAPEKSRLEAYAAFRLGDLRLAREAYRRLLIAWPGDAESWINLGAVLTGLEEFNEAIGAYQRSIALRPDDVELHLAFAAMLGQTHNRQLRRDVLRAAALLRPNDYEIQFALGLAEAAAQDIGAAEVALERAIALQPESSTAWLELGLILENRNDLDALERLIELAGSRVGNEINLLQAWLAFRQKRFIDARAYASAIPESISALRRHHIRGEIADRLQDPSTAFASYTKMNKAALAEAPNLPNGPSYRERVTGETISLRKATFSNVRVDTSLRESPILIAGFPRSGTTLLDTILGRLPNACVLEEEAFLPTIEYKIGGAVAALRMSPEELSAYRRDYFAALDTTYPEASAQKVIDKHPLHMARLPLIARLFPDAKILFVERHPFDVILSCFFSNFALNHATVSFTDIVEAAKTYSAVFTAWFEAKEVLPISVHHVRYERLVQSPENETRAALSFIGAEFEMNLLDNVAGARDRGNIRTASYAQVTERLYQRSIGRWTRYREQLAPAIPILSPWAERMGYEI